MKNLVFASLLLTTTAFASSMYMEITPRFGTTTTTSEDKHKNEVESDRETASGFDLKIGFGEFTQNRHEAVLSYMSIDKLGVANWHGADVKDIKLATIGYNGVFTIERLGNEQIMPFFDWRFAAGKADYKYIEKESSFLLAVGIGLGSYFKISDNIEATASLRYDIYNYRADLYACYGNRWSSGCAVREEEWKIETGVTSLNAGLIYRF